MLLKLVRAEKNSRATIGKLYVNGQWECFTLEDTVRPAGEKIYGETAIPVGKYRVTVNYSNRFKRLLPLLHNVPQFEGVRIHPGNHPEDTEGCILVGRSKGSNVVHESQLAFKSLFPKIQAALANGENVWLEIGD